MQYRLKTKWPIGIIHRARSTMETTLLAPTRRNSHVHYNDYCADSCTVDSPNRSSVSQMHSAYFLSHVNWHTHTDTGTTCCFVFLHKPPSAVRLDATALRYFLFFFGEASLGYICTCACVQYTPEQTTSTMFGFPELCGHNVCSKFPTSTAVRILLRRKIVGLFHAQHITRTKKLQII